MYHLWLSVSQVSKFGPRLSGWGCGGVGCGGGGGGWKAEHAEVIHDGGAHSKLSTPERTGTPPLPFHPICGGLLRTFKTDAAIFHPQSHPPAPMYRWISPGKCRASSCWCSSQRKVSARRWPAHTGCGAAWNLGGNYSSCLLWTIPQAAALTERSRKQLEVGESKPVDLSCGCRL